MVHVIGGCRVPLLRILKIFKPEGADKVQGDWKIMIIITIYIYILFTYIIS